MKTQSMMISRQTYDAMIGQRPDFMANGWQAFKSRKWSIGGVMVHATPEQLEQLRDVIAGLN